jgi:hypothetical protein
MDIRAPDDGDGSWIAEADDDPDIAHFSLGRRRHAAGCQPATLSS